MGTPGRGRLRPPSWRALLVTSAAASLLLLWALTGWSWTVFAVAVAAALIVRVLALLLPRRLRGHSGALAALAAIVMFIAQSSPWAVLFCVGVACTCLVLGQFGTRQASALLVVTVAAAATGAIGLALEYASARASRDAEYAAAGTHARAQMLPGDPVNSVAELMRQLSQPGVDDAACSLMFDGQGRRAFAVAHSSPDCPAAMRAARDRITDPLRYRERIDLTSLTVRAADTLAEVDTCHVRWRSNALDTRLTGVSVAPCRPLGHPSANSPSPRFRAAGWSPTSTPADQPAASLPGSPAGKSESS